MPIAMNIAGQRFGRLVAIEDSGNKPGAGRSWRCRCDCGNETIVPVRILRFGDTRSCGCFDKERRQHPPLIERFWSRVLKSDGCWLWTAGNNGLGYGMLQQGTGNRKMILAHRLSWTIHFGEIPHGMDILHVCDNPPCVRPDHLFIGTNSDNVADKVVKDRAARTLTRERVLQIRKLRSEGMLLREIATGIGVSIATVGKIVNRDSWSHVP